MTAAEYGDIYVFEVFPTAQEGRVPGRGVGVWAARISVAGRAALVHAAAAGSMRVRSSRKGAMVSRVM